MRDGDALDEADEDAAGLGRWLNNPDELLRALATQAQPALERTAVHALGLWWGAAVDGIRASASHAVGQCIQCVADAAWVSAAVRRWEQNGAQTRAQRSLPWPAVASDRMIQDAAAGGLLFESAIEPLLQQRARALQREAVERALELPDTFVADGEVVDVLSGHLPWRPLPSGGGGAVAELLSDVRAGMDVVPPAARSLSSAVGSALLAAWRDAEAWWQQMSGAAVAPEAAACAAHLAERWEAAAERLARWAVLAVEQAQAAIAADERAVLDGDAGAADMPHGVVLCVKGAWAARALADVPRQIAADGTLLMRECWAQQPTVSAVALQLDETARGLLVPWLTHLGSSAALSWADRFDHLYLRIPRALQSDVAATRRDVVRAWMASSAAAASDVWPARYAALRRIAMAAPAPAAAPATHVSVSASIPALTAQLVMRMQAVCGLGALCGSRAETRHRIRAAFLQTAEMAAAGRLEQQRRQRAAGDASANEWDSAQLAADLDFVLRQLGADAPALPLPAAGHAGHPCLAAMLEAR
ncbi:hypothetical protein LPJ61_003313 [Coemansia biformis]|uniref:Uncharacterized protein n=1 Tax=Coemansia biformis TaxID=1286918 RepID=A0A9W7YBG3_9FUNG|nr:hypothetical protein LPJ61_003313 [Coemansia biformis]